MDRLAQYHHLIQELLSEFVEWANTDVDEESEIISLFDKKHDHYGDAMHFRMYKGSHSSVYGTFLRALHLF